MKRYLLLFLITCVILPTTSSSEVKEINLNPLKNKPVFSLEVDLKGGSYAIEVNGMIILEDYSDQGNIITTIPINHWMHNLNNEIALNIFPTNDGEAISSSVNFSITLIVSDFDSKDSKYYKVASIDYDGSLLNDTTRNSSKSGKYNSNNEFLNDDNGDVVVEDITREELDDSPGALYLKRKIIIPSSLPLWAFFKSDDFPMHNFAKSKEDYMSGLNEILDKYLQVQKAIETGDIDSVLPMFNERNSEYEKALHISSGIMDKKVKDTLLDMSSDKDAELLILTNKYVNIEVFPNNKLVRLTRGGTTPAIVQNFKSFKGSQHFDMIFRYEKGKWILTR